MKFVFGLLLALLPAIAVAHAPVITGLDNIEQATVYVGTMLSEDGSPETVSYCSGYVAARSPAGGLLIVTAGHCIGMTAIPSSGVTINVRPVYVKFHDGSRADVLQAIKCKGCDEGLLLVKDPGSHQAVTFDTRQLQQAEPLYIYGAPNYHTWFLGEGFAENHDMGAPANDNLLYPNEILWACSTCGPGDSGAPVFNDEGRVVGTEVEASSYQGCSYLVPAQVILDFIAAQ